MTIYYVDSAGGSDSSTGTSSTAAFQSIAKINSLTLKAGDTVLLARGSSFADMLTIKNSGSVTAPITFGAYGSGEDPKFTGGQGIYGTKTSNIVIKDIAFETKGNAIYAAQAINWNIDGVTLTNAGYGTGTGSISMKNSTNVTIQNSTFDHVANDGIYVVSMTGLTIKNNVMSHLHGSTADGIQVTDSTGIRVEGNVIDQSTSPDTTKGGVIMNNVKDVVVSDNQIAGGSFGVAVNGWDVAITDNKISGQVKYDWSAAIMASAGTDLGNYTISGNQISDSKFGVALTGLSSDGPVTRSNVQVDDNYFVNITRAALKIDKESTGSFENNVVAGGDATSIRGDGTKGAFTVSDNLVTGAATIAQAVQIKADYAAAEVASKAAAAEAAALVAHAQAEALAKTQADAVAKAQADAAVATVKIGVNADKFAMDVAGHNINGNILANDLDSTGHTLKLSNFGGQRVGASGLDVQGKYGLLHVNADGTFAYQLAADALTKLKNVAAPVDAFSYKVSSGGKPVNTTLSIDLTTYIRTQDGTSAAAKAAAAALLPQEKAKAVDDHFSIGLDGHLTGNVSANDLTSTGGTLSLRTVEGVRVDGGIDLKGDFGSLHIDQTGAFTYSLYDNADALLAAKPNAVEGFIYKSALGSDYDQGGLIIDLASYLHAAADAHHLM